MGKVFIADDSQIQAVLFEKILSPEGYEVYTFCNGVEVIKELPELVISEIEMPERDGFELISKIYEQKKYQDIPFFISSHHDEATIKK